VDFFTRLFDSSGFVPRAQCGEWTTRLVLLHNISDAFIWLSYLLIPVVLLSFIRSRRDMPFRRIFWLFGAFIVLCGTTHLLEVVMFYWPHYRLAGLIKLATAVVSVATVISLVPIMPVALAMRSPQELEREVADRKQVEEALRLTNSRLEMAVRGSNIGIFEFDMPDGVVQNSRSSFINVWEQCGYDRPEGSTDFAAPMALVHPDDREQLEQAIQSYLSGAADGFQVEHRVLCKDGADRWMLARGVAVRDSSDKPIRFIGSSIDITDLRQAEEALRESEERFRGTFENAAVGIAQQDAQGRFLRVNEKYCEIVGYSRDELLQKTFMDITHADDLADELGQYNPLMRGELSSYSLEKRYIRKDGSILWIDLTTSLQRDPEGNPAYAIAILQDISERKRLELESRHAREAAEAANRAKDEFLANVSHEIRTPMNAILGMTELVLDTPLAEDQRQCLETVKSAADNLLCIINDLLDFSKIEAGKLELDPANFSLRESLSDIMRALAVRAHKKGLELVCDVPRIVPDALIGDAGRLRQVLLNLVGNAIKFTEDGEAVIRVEVASDPSIEPEVGLRFTVSDTGIGIPLDRQKTIFRAFEQEDTSTTRRFGGTGLGLTIAAQLVALMGGEITLESEPGRGSTFGFTARFGRQSQASEPLAARTPAVLKDLPVLIVDDNATNRHILEECLRGWQMKPSAAGDGVTAVDALWHSVACGRPFPLVLLDARMPDTDGLALAAKIRQREELAATRIILLTSGERVGDQARVRELQIDAYLLKPVQQYELLATIDRVMNRAAADTSPTNEPAKSPRPAAATLRILVAEDNEFNTRLIERLLVRCGYHVRLANNGREALALLGVDGQGFGVGRQEAEADAEESRPPRNAGPCPLTTGFDLLLLDLHMPEFDGFQVIQAIREWEAAAEGHLPVIALTARSRKEDRDRCLASGMDEYVSKPVRAAELFAAIDRVVSPQVHAPSGQPEEGDRTSLLDHVVLLASCGDNADGLGELCQDFLAYAPARLAEVSDALRVKDAPRLREAAHKFRGLLAAFSTTAGDLASDLEDHAARGQLDEAGPLVRRLEEMVQELIRQVGGLSYESLRQQPRADNGPDRINGPGFANQVHDSSREAPRGL